MCGSSSIPWHHARTALWVMYLKAIARPPGYSEDISAWDVANSRFRRKVNDVAVLYRNSEHDGGDFDNKWDFLNLVGLSRRAQCLDARDRVFALLSLVSPRQLQIKPDYSRSLTHVMRATVEDLMRLQFRFDFLSLCDLDSRQNGVPSWIPNFARLPDRDLIRSVQLCGSLDNQPRVINDIMYVLGIHVTSIKEVYRGLSSSNSRPSAEVATTVLRLIHETNTGDNAERLANLLETLPAGWFRKSYSSPGSNSKLRLPFNATKKHTAWFMKGGMVGSVDEAHRVQYEDYLRICGTYLLQRDIFLDENDCFGLCPTGTEPGDVLVTIVGTCNPVVLRRLDDGTYNVVGEAYHRKYMQKESILGPLPYAFRSVQNDVNFCVFLNVDTGQIHVDDPRLGELPAGWSKIEDHALMDHCLLLQDESSGEKVYSHEFDPRTTPNELRKRGVELQEFRLA